MSIHEECLLVAVNISQWTARKFDKDASSETNAHYGATENGGRFNKQLISRESMSEVSKAATELRNYVYKVTLPWNNANQRLLSSKLYFDFTKKVRELTAVFDTAADGLANQYGVLVQDAVINLNGLYNAGDYPDPADIREKFSVNVDIVPVPAGDHLILDIEDRECQKLRDELDANVDKMVSDAKREVWERL